MNARLTLTLNSATRADETFALSLLWLLVFGPHGESYKSYTHYGNVMTYEGGSEIINKMNACIVGRIWEDDIFQSKEVQDAIRTFLAAMPYPPRDTFNPVDALRSWNNRLTNVICMPL